MTLLYNAVIVTGTRQFHGWILLSGKTILQVGKTGDEPELSSQDITRIDCNGDYLMPGVIDPHVHFRDPGLTHKGDFASESRAAVAGGVTSVLDMPNTNPATTSPKSWMEKFNIAHEKSLVNFGLFIGATNNNFDELAGANYSTIPGIKLFMGSSTGNMLVDRDEMLNKLFESHPAIIAIHAEDEATIKANRNAIEAEYAGGQVPVSLHSRLRDVKGCVTASRHAIELARKYDARIHLCHISTAAELDLLDADSKVKNKKITAETCPQYLLFTEDDLQIKGSKLKCNPAIKSVADRDALLQAIHDNKIDLIATDHAPHLPADKEGDLFHAASGMPGIQFSLVLMLTLLGKPTLVAKLMSNNPATIYNIEKKGFLKKGYDADIVRVRKLEHPHTITDSEVLSKCGWTPYAGLETNYQVVSTWVNGKLVYDNGHIAENPDKGLGLLFNNA